MAAGTGRMGWAKRSAYMTTLAGNVGVRTVEYEASTKVIEWLLRPGVYCRKQQQTHKQDL